MTSHALNKVLVVDDDPAILRLVEAHLKGDGYDLYFASDGRQAEELVQQVEPSFLITDWDMPGMDGLTLCRRVRELDLLHYVYVVFLTGRAGEEDLQQAMEAGADDFLVKPLRKQELFARLTAGARVVRLESHLSKLATEDTLTGLLVRRAFHGYLSKEWHRARRGRQPLSVVMIDIDHFKRINDTHGHPAGDETIYTVAQVIQNNSRKSDIACRYGGEEFCVVLPETDGASAHEWAERLRKQVAQTEIWTGAAALKVTISAGVAEMVADLDAPGDLLKLSDQCLLAAKQAGRDRVVSHFELTERDDLCDARPFSLARVQARDAMVPLVYFLSPEWPVARGAAYLLQYRVSSAPVTDESGALLGLLSDQDVLTAANAFDAANRPVADVMRTNVITYQDDASLATIFRFMMRASVRSVVITSSGKPCGLVTRASLVRWLLDHQWADQITAQDSEQVRMPELVEGRQAPLLMLAEELAVEAEQLRSFLQNSQNDEDAGPLVGGASRMQQLIDELLAGSANHNLVGGGFPFF